MLGWLCSPRKPGPCFCPVSPPPHCGNDAAAGGPDQRLPDAHGSWRGASAFWDWAPRKGSRAGLRQRARPRLRGAEPDYWKRTVCARQWLDTSKRQSRLAGIFIPLRPSLPLPGTLQLEMKDGSGETPFCNSFKRDQQNSCPGRFGPEHQALGISMGSRRSTGDRKERPGVRQCGIQPAGSNTKKPPDLSK